MKILITGADGFIGRNLTAEFRNRGYSELLLNDVDTPHALLDEYTASCDFVYHLAGVNRPENPEDFMAGNHGFTSVLLDRLKRHNNKAPILMSSSIQAERDNPYGRSKKAAEVLLAAYGQETGTRVFPYRLPNVFGKWCRPNYNSVVATFCHNIASGLPIQIHDPDAGLSLVYIDDVVSAFVRMINDEETFGGGFCVVEPVYSVTVGQVAELIRTFRDSRTSLSVPRLDDSFEKKLYSTYLSYLPTDGFSYALNMNVDQRGSFTEFMRTQDRGQISVNISNPGITKGNHWHHTKVEKFLVVYGSGVIRFRQIDRTEVIEYPVSGDMLSVVDIPPGYTHSLVNTGDTDMVTLIWANECLDPERPDTYALEV